MIADTPTIMAASYGHAAQSATDWYNTIDDVLVTDEPPPAKKATVAQLAGLMMPRKFREPHQQQTQTEPMPAQNPARRLISVFIVDPHPDVPLNKCLLFKGEEKLTDLTDQELYFELDIKGIIETHNAYRITVVDKEASKARDKDVMLEPIRVRDLKMVVLTIAQF